MRFILASNNPKKLKELREILAGLGAELVTQREAGLLAEAEETGESFEENARIKALFACQALGEPAIADDSGLVVEALGGAPGVYSARYGGETCGSDAERTALLLTNMAGQNNRRAKFVSCIACVFPDGRETAARGECVGTISLSARGESGFGYDPVFELPGTGRTLAELTPEEKNAVSHRGAALREFEKKLRGLLND
ncbi:MAG: RdgB/HAM1 family non-canonical purine NTP pyrophosphatase [Oscillospiraceae bacterium]|jgi:XTP/dITP diphosphohydrolase|nr:RdgB/HAM1 family non-canonical purine NTP pyrophosphatase [Oscillospiraceae bacterium]